MKDQVQNLKKRGIKALAIYSGMSRQEILTTLENCIFGNYKFLYISPERLDTEIFRTKLQKMKISMITVDESHCISQWGYDFRPAYLKIAEIRDILPDVPVLALTATATPEVVKDIQARLRFRKENVFRMSFERRNLAYIVRNTDNKTGELLHILRRMPGSAIIYVRTRRRSKEIAIRKVNGAEASGILKLLIYDILNISVISVLIGTAASYFTGQIWLEQFSERIDMDLLLFIGIALLVLLVIVACVVVKAWHVANENPVKSIKAE